VVVASCARPKQQQHLEPGRPRARRSRASSGGPAMPVAMLADSWRPARPYDSGGGARRRRSKVK
jgi:hypothetical protein